MQKNNLIKRYFLWVATTLDPFVTPLILGGIVGVGAGFCALMLAPQLAMVLALGLTGLGACLGVLSWTVCHIFVGYRRESGLFLVIYEGQTIRRLQAFGNPLWWRKSALLEEESIRWVPLADTTSVYAVNASPPRAIRSVPVKIQVFFVGEFDGQEVYERIVKAGYGGLDSLVRWWFSEVVASSPGLEQKLLSMGGYPLAGLKRELEKLSQRFPSAGLLSNIEKIDVELVPKVIISF